MRKRFGLVVLALCFGVSAVPAAVPQYGGHVAAVESRPRLGIGHVMEKIRAERPIQIAYFGGSITEMDGWRRLSREWLQVRYPKCAFSEIPAAIGGTGSSLGVFRFGQDVLAKKPDLVFVEFATNDHNDSPEEIWRNLEGCLRQAWQEDPEIDFVFVYTITNVMMDDYGKGLCTRAASAMEQLADHYGIPSVNFGPRVAAEVAFGRLVMSVGEVPTAVPPEEPNRDQLIAEELAKEGKVLFSKDGVHPVLQGHGYYLESLKAAWPALEGLAPVDHEAQLKSPFGDTTMERAKMISPEKGTMNGVWEMIPPEGKNGGFTSRFGGAPYLTKTAGSQLSFRFKGTRCLIYDVLGPDCGQVWVSVDGVRRPSPVVRFDRFCTYYRVATLDVFAGTDGVHEVALELDANQPDRTSVKEQGVTDEELRGAKYDGIEWMVGRIMLVGELIGAEPLPASASWFEAGIENYARWPRDAAKADRCSWSAASAGLAQVASLTSPGVLDVAAEGRPLHLDAEERLTLGQGVRSITISSDLELTPWTAEELPAVDPAWKAAVIVGCDDGGVCYYGLHREGEANGWVRLEGVTVSKKTFARLDLTFARSGPEVVVSYAIDGVVASVDGQSSVPVAASPCFSGVGYVGCGQVTSVSGARENAARGLSVIICRN